MVQEDERIYYNADNILVTQFRFVTNDGRTVPTSTIQRTEFVVVPAHRPSGLGRQIILLGFSVLLLFGGTVACGFAGHYYDADPNPGLAIAFLALGLSVWPAMFVVYLMVRGRRIPQYYRGDVMFAGGGTYNLQETVIAHNQTTASVFGTTTRTADYSFLSFSREDAESFIAAVNEAMVAVQRSR
jgi:hypothetical protein